MAAEYEEEQRASMRNLAGMLHSVYFGTLLTLKKEKYFDSFCGGESSGLSPAAVHPGYKSENSYLFFST